MLYFAYDGTVHGDWASHYAVRMALHHRDQTLCLIHVDEKQMDRHVGLTPLHARVAHIEEECRLAGVKLKTEISPIGVSIFEDLDSFIPTGPDIFVLCGTRAQERDSGYLSGTAVEKLLAARRRNVLALRVVKPGLLGRPQSLLVPMRGRPGHFRHGLPFLELLAPDLKSIRLLMIEELSRFRFRRLSHEATQRLHDQALSHLSEVARSLKERFGASPLVEIQSGVSDDVPKEIVISANRAQSQLILLGASRRKLGERFMYGNPIEQVLRNAPCDVAVFGGCE